MNHDYETKCAEMEDALDCASSGVEILHPENDRP